MYDRKVIKQDARRAMKASAPHFMLFALVYYLLTSGLHILSSCLTLGGSDSGIIGSLGLFLNILLSLFSMVMALGFCNYTLRLVRGEPTGMQSLFAGFALAGRAIGLRFIIFLFSLLWVLAFMFPFCILAGGMMAVSFTELTLLLVFVLYIAVLVGLYVVILRYSMAEYALLDHPDDGVMTAIRRSKGMMSGWTGKLFVLDLSFLGWSLLVDLIIGAIIGVCMLVDNVDWIEVFTIAVYSASHQSEPLDLFAALGVSSLWLLLYYGISTLVSLPLQLWLMVYQSTARARFYNYVGGYDYEQYMKAQNAPQQPQQPLWTDPRQQIPSADSSGAPQAPAVLPIQPAEYYTPLNLPEETEPDEVNEAEELETPEAPPED